MYSVNICWINEWRRAGKRRGNDWMLSLCLASCVVRFECFGHCHQRPPESQLLFLPSVSIFLSLSAALPMAAPSSSLASLISCFPGFPLTSLTAFVPLLCLWMLACLALGLRSTPLFLHFLPGWSHLVIASSVTSFSHWFSNFYRQHQASELQI